MEIEFRGKKIQVKELPYMEAVDLNPADRKGTIKKLFTFCLGLSEEEINSLTIKEGLELDKVIAELNGLNQNFQNPTEKKE